MFREEELCPCVRVICGNEFTYLIDVNHLNPRHTVSKYMTDVISVWQVVLIQKLLLTFFLSSCQNVVHGSLTIAFHCMLAKPSVFYLGHIEN